MFHRILLACILVALFCSSPAESQHQPPQPYITCSVGNDQIFLFTNLAYNSRSNPGFRQARRDPSGKMFLQLWSFSPNDSFFISWQGALFQFKRGIGGAHIGNCVNHLPIPVRSYGSGYTRLPLGEGHVRVGGTHMHARKLPEAYTPGRPFTPPLIASEQEALNCAKRARTQKNKGKAKEFFGNCMVDTMLGENERKVLQCERRAKGDNTARALCVVGALGGKKERKAAQIIANCYETHGDDYDEFPLCMAKNSLNEDAANLLSCIEQQAENGDVSFYGTASCYAGKTVQLKPEHQIALECAVSTGGEPYSFATCAGGRLTARELDKCLTVGIGGDKGCFGKNNDIVKALSNIGGELQRVKNQFAGHWNSAVRDLTEGPGKHNTARKIISNTANDIVKGPGKNNTIRKTLESVVPGFSW